jgi:hypothetical protein
VNEDLEICFGIRCDQSSFVHIWEEKEELLYLPRGMADNDRVCIGAFSGASRAAQWQGLTIGGLTILTYPCGRNQNTPRSVGRDAPGTDSRYLGGS